MRGSWVTAGNGYGRAGRRLGRVLAASAVDLVELLGLRVVGLHLVVADRPRGETPSWWRSSPKSSARSRYSAAPYSLVAPPTK